jgi:arabinofuranosyltransferase
MQTARILARVPGPVLRGRLALALYASSAAYAGITLCRYPRWTVDDAYILFRYAKHLVDHGQLTWTVGSDPVEGYTGIALPLLVAGGMRLGLAPQGLTRWLGIVAFFFGAWTLRSNQRRLGVAEPVRAYVTATTMLFSPLFAHATSGLETLLFAALLGTSFTSLLDCEKSPRPEAQAQLWLKLLILSLVRPEGVLFAVAFGGALAARLLHETHRRLHGAAIAFGLFGLPYGAYFAWRAMYYGRFLPNTYYAKATVGGFDPTFFWTTAAMVDRFLPAIVAGAALSLLRPSAIRPPRRPTIAACGAMFLLSLGYSRSTLIMGYLFRFQVHALFLVLPFLGLLLANGDRAGATLLRSRRATGMIAALVAVCLVAWPVELLAAAGETQSLSQRYLDIESEQHARIGAWLRDHLPPSESIACWVDAGLIPFVADDHKVIDFGRLNDEYLARPLVTREEIAAHFFEARPGALILTSDSAMRLEPEHGARIVTDDPRFAEYESVFTFCSPEYGGSPCEVLFLRRGVGTQ